MTPTQLKALLESVIDLITDKDGEPRSDSITIEHVGIRPNGRIRVHLTWATFTALFAGQDVSDRRNGTWSVRKGAITLLAQEPKKLGLTVPSA